MKFILPANKEHMVLKKTTPTNSENWYGGLYRQTMEWLKQKEEKENVQNYTRKNQEWYDLVASQKITQVKLYPFYRWTAVRNGMIIYMCTSARV